MIVEGETKSVELDSNTVRIYDNATAKLEDQIPLCDITGVEFCSRSLKLKQRSRIFDSNKIITWADINKDYIFKRLANAIRADIDPAYAQLIPRVDLVESAVRELNLGYAHPGEIEELPRALQDEERIEFMAYGSCKRDFHPKSGTGLWTITDQRLIFIDRSLVGGTSYSIPFNKIDLKASSNDITEGKIKLYTADYGLLSMDIPSQNTLIFIDMIGNKTTEKDFSDSASIPLEKNFIRALNESITAVLASNALVNILTDPKTSFLIDGLIKKIIENHKDAKMSDILIEMLNDKNFWSKLGKSLADSAENPTIKAIGKALMDEKNIDLAKKAIMGLGRSLAANLLIQKVESRIDWKIASQMTGSSPTLDKLMQVALIIIYTYSKIKISGK